MPTIHARMIGCLRMKAAIEEVMVVVLSGAEGCAVLLIGLFLFDRD
jgi:hypothetical protein